MFEENLEIRDVITTDPTLTDIKIEEDVEESVLGNNQQTNQQPNEPYILGDTGYNEPLLSPTSVFCNMSTTQKATSSSQVTVVSPQVKETSIIIVERGNVMTVNQTREIYNALHRVCHTIGGACRAINRVEVQEVAKANSSTATKRPPDMKNRKCGGMQTEKCGLLETCSRAMWEFFTTSVTGSHLI